MAEPNQPIPPNVFVELNTLYTAEQVRELVRAAKEQERERIAKLCDSLHSFDPDNTGQTCARAIRAGYPA